MKCNQCEQLRINGIVCHEIGCPNMGRTWDAEREQWLKYFQCFECGCDVEEGESCDCQTYEGELDQNDFEHELEDEEDGSAEVSQ